jgi:hypothetical protein
MASLEAALRASPEAAQEQDFGGLAAEAAAATWHSNTPKRALRATDQFFADLDLLIRYQRLDDDEASDLGAFQQMIEDSERQREWRRPFGNPLRRRVQASELDRPPSDRDNDTLRNPEDPSPKVPLARSRLPDIEAKFRSLKPGLTRKQQFEAVRAEFAPTHLTDRVLREACKVVQVRLGRPRTRRQA